MTLSVKFPDVSASFSLCLTNSQNMFLPQLLALVVQARIKLIFSAPFWILIKEEYFTLPQFLKKYLHIILSFCAIKDVHGNCLCACFLHM